MRRKKEDFPMTTITPPSAQRIGMLWLLSCIWLTLLFCTLHVSTQAVAAQQAMAPVSLAQTTLVTKTAQLFMAVLASANETPTVSSPATGYALLALDADGATLRYRLVTTNLRNITAAHIHVGSPGQNGDVVVALAVGTNGSISGTLTLSPTQVADLQAGVYYINVHTSQHPTGEARGQIVKFAPPSHYNALLTGSQQVPTVTTNAVGVAHFSLVNSDTLHYSVAVSNITEIQSAHIHKGELGVNNPTPTYAIYTGTGTFSPTHPLSGALHLDGQGILDLLSGAYYLNIHTTQHPAGEIRGQIGGVSAYAAHLRSTQVTTPAITLPGDRALFALSADGAHLSYRIMVTNINTVSVTMIDIQRVDVANTTVITLYRSAGTGAPTHPISGSVPVSISDLQNLAAGKLSLKVSTADFPGFMLAGQIEPYSAPVNFHALLATQIPVTATNVTNVQAPNKGTGQATFQLYTEPALLSYQLTVTGSITPTAAYLRQGARGETGPVIATLHAGDSHFAPGQPTAGFLFLDEQNLVDLLTGYTYVTIATAAQPAGALRGQVETSSTHWQTFLPVTLRQVQSTPRYKFNIVVVSHCERQPAGNWFEGTTSVNSVPESGYKVVFSYAPDALPVTQPAISGPHQDYPGWKPGYYSHIIRASNPIQGDWYVWIIDDANQRISEIGHWQSTGPGEGCNQAVVDFDSRP
jgi:hypothetical protein